MALALAATKTAPDTYRFDITGVDIAAAPTFVINFGDASAPLTVTTDTDGTTTVSHTYTDPGHHTYTVTVTAARTPYARTLAELAAAGQPNESMFAAVGPGGSFDSNRESGHRFTAVKAGVVRAIKFWRLDTNPITTRNVNLWNATTQALLATAVSAGETGSGWRTVPLVPACPVAAAGSYIAAYGTRDRSPTITPIPSGGSTNLTPVEPRNGNAGAGTFPNTVGSSYTYADVVYAPYGGTLTTLAGTAATLADWPRSQESATAAVTVDVGPATINATVIAGTPIPAVQVDVWIGNPGGVIGWTVYRDTPGASVPIWVGSTSSGAMSFVDYTAPLNTAVTYRLVLTYADFSSVVVTSAPVTITGTTGCYLTDPTTGATLRVELVSWPSRHRAPRQAVLEVLGRPDPVVLSDVHTTPHGTWTFITRTDVDTAALVAMLINLVGVVIYRAQPGSSIPSCTAAVGEVEERRYSGAAGDQRRYIVVEVQEIAPLPATALPLNATLGGLATYDGDTLGELSQLRPTLLQLSMIVTG